MPTTKSAKKRLRQSLERRLRNRATRSVLKSQIRKVSEAIDAKDADKAAAEFRSATRKLDQAVGKNVIHKNTAARVKSRLSARIKAAKATPAAG